MASTSTSKEISFSRSRLRRMLRSMSMGSVLLAEVLRLNSTWTSALATSA